MIPCSHARTVAIVARPEAQVSGRLRLRLQVKNDQPIGAGSVVKESTKGWAGAGLVGTLARWHRQYAVKSAARLIETGRHTNTRSHRALR